MEKCLKQETKNLKKAWACYTPNVLRDYLIQDVEDPRINIQSILTRHFLIEKFFPEKFRFLMEHELRFGLVVNWLIKLLKDPIMSNKFNMLLPALITPQKNINEMLIPKYVSETFKILELPNYICDLLIWASGDTAGMPIPDFLINTFQNIWLEELKEEKCTKISVLEPACGSANDFRFINSFGISRFLDYTGFDLCQSNICNARQMFPEIDFKVGNVFEIDRPDNSFDYCFLHDLFEHISLAGIEASIKELCRVVRKEICVGFFNMHNSKHHIVKPLRNYYWNTLSMTKIKDIFNSYGCAVESLHIKTFLKTRFDCRDTHNKNAYTFIISRK